MSLRPNLGDFCSIVCFKYAILGIEDVLGVDGAATVLIRAGRIRGETVAKDAGLAGSNPPADTIGVTLNKFLGKEGTCLCEIESVAQMGDKLVVRTQETLCSAGEEPGSQRKCTYTLGAVQGFLEATTGRKLVGKHEECVLRGGKADVFVFSDVP